MVKHYHILSLASQEAKQLTIKPQTAGHTSRFARLVNNAPDLLMQIGVYMYMTVYTRMCTCITCTCTINQKQDGVSYRGRL